MKFAPSAWGQLKRGQEVVAVGEICFEGMGAVQKGFQVVAVGEMCFGSMEIVTRSRGGPATGRCGDTHR